MRKIFMTIFAAITVFFLSTNVSSVTAQEIFEEFTLEEITITAQKREENQQKTAMAVEVITAEDLQRSGKADLTDILSNVPGLITNTASDGLRISLRGISDDTATFKGQSMSTPAVAVNTDGVYSNRKDSGTGLFDLERVEVLYGPQSTLYASTSPGGIVNLITASPKLDKFAVSATVEAGNYGLLHTEGSVNAPITDTVALRAAFTTSKHDGYLSNGGNSADTKAARLRTLFQPNDNLSFTVTGEISKSSAFPFSGVTGFIDEASLDDPWENDDKVLGDPVEDTEKKLNARMDLDLGFASLSVIPSYSTQDQDGQRVSTIEVQGDSGNIQIDEYTDSNDQKGIEMRMVSSSDSPIKWILGANYYDSEDSMSSVAFEDGVVTGEYQISRMEEELKAFYGNLTYPVTDRFRTTVGYRQSWDWLYNYRDGGHLTKGVDVPYVESEITEDEGDYHFPDYKLGAEYDLAEDSMIYADFSTSYRSQGMGTGTNKIQKLKAYTIGSKNQFLNNKLQVNFSAYYYDYRNYKASTSVRAYAGVYPADQYWSTYEADEPNTTAYGDGTMIGFDLDTDFIITSKDDMKFMVSYLKSEWEDLIFDYYYDYQITSTTRLPEGTVYEVEVGPLENLDYTGLPMTNAPKWTFSTVYSHRFGLWNGGFIETQVELLYKTHFRLTWDKDDYPYNYQESYHCTNLSATYNDPNDRWNFTGYVRNLEDYAVKNGYFPAPDNQAYLGNPRTYGAILSVRY